MPNPESNGQQPFNPVIVNPQGRPARAEKAADCPRCGEGPEKRTASSGFGERHPVCRCGHEFVYEVWRG